MKTTVVTTVVDCSNVVVVVIEVVSVVVVVVATYEVVVDVGVVLVTDCDRYVKVEVDDAPGP